MAEDKTIIRVQKNKDNPYVVLNKKFLDDYRMSWRAKGILAYLLAKPDNWQVYVADLVKRSTEGRDAVYTVIKELIKCGYMTREQKRNSAGHLSGTEYTVYEQPLTENPYTDKPDTAEPFTANPTQVINNLSNNDCTKEQQHVVVFFEQVTGATTDLSPLLSAYGPDQVRSAIEYMQRYRRRKRVDNPYGFIADSLRYGWDFGQPPKTNIEKTQEYLAANESLPRTSPEQAKEIIAQFKKLLR